jgi:hypothetical protein
MNRPYLIGWYYAIKRLFKILFRTKNKRLKTTFYIFWKQQLKKKYFWYTTEELVEVNKKCWDEIKKRHQELNPELARAIYNYEDDEEDY